jgi:hypothetical protein
LGGWNAVLDFEGRNAVSSSTGRRVLLAAFEHTAVILDLTTGACSKSLETVFSAGGKRLALSDEVDVLLAAAYHVHGLAAYSCKTGREQWRRRDLKKVQQITLARDGIAAYCGREGASLAVVDLRSGETTRTLRGARALYDSRFESMQFVDAGKPKLLRGAGRRKVFVERTTFAFLDVCFAPGLLTLSEVGGAVRCLDTASGRERWRYQPGAGRHVLHLGYQEAEPCLLGVEWSYAKGGVQRLIRWSPDDGRLIDSTIIGKPADSCFGLRGEVVVLADGQVIATTPTKRKRLI